MGYGLRRTKVEGGSGGKRGHSNMVHWEYTEEIKQRSRKARRRAGKALEREARQARESPEGPGTLLLFDPPIRPRIQDPHEVRRRISALAVSQSMNFDFPVLMAILLDEQVRCS